MNSKVIKCVAGAGKTTSSCEYMQTHKNGLYLAFNNDVVNMISTKGLLSKTIDSFFQSYLIPKFANIIPLIGPNKKIKYLSAEDLPNSLKGVCRIKIDINGDICNQAKKTLVSLNDTNSYLHSLGYFSNSTFIKYIFSENELRLTNELRMELSEFLINKYPNLIIELIASRFSFIIIDEAQDLKGYRELFARLIYNSDIELIIIGDDNQNINGGGGWFELLRADDIRNRSYRCPDENCKWIRDNLQIDISGNTEFKSRVKTIQWPDVYALDDGIRTLLYTQNAGKNKEVIGKWKGPKTTIKSAKGLTIDNDIVIIGDTLNIKNLYTAVTRTRKNVYLTARPV